MAYCDLKKFLWRMGAEADKPSTAPHRQAGFIQVDGTEVLMFFAGDDLTWVQVGGESVSGESLGGGVDVYKDTVGGSLRFNSLGGTTYITITPVADKLNISLNNLPASIINSGTFDEARIPTLTAAKIPWSSPASTIGATVQQDALFKDSVIVGSYGSDAVRNVLLRAVANSSNPLKIMFRESSDVAGMTLQYVGSNDTLQIRVHNSGDATGVESFTFYRATGQMGINKPSSGAAPGGMLEIQPINVAGSQIPIMLGRTSGYSSIGTTDGWLMLDGGASGLGLNYYTTSDIIMNRNGGNVGIGLITPVELLHLHKTSATNTYIQITNGASGFTSSDGLTIGITGSNEGIIRMRDDERMRFGQDDTDCLILETSGDVRIINALEIDGALNHDGTTYGFRGVNPSAPPSFGAITGTLKHTSWTTGTVTLNELAQVVGALMTWLKNCGFI